MQNENRTVKMIAHDILKKKQADRLIGWQKGLFYHDNTPAVFSDPESLTSFVYNAFCGANLSKFLVKESKHAGITAVLLKPCDRYSLNQLVKEHRINKDKVMAVDIECDGMLNHEKMRALGMKGVQDIKKQGDKLTVETLAGTKHCSKQDVMLDKCLSCKDRLGVQDFDAVLAIEAMTPEERFMFWRGELSKCMRCNACRNVCPACTCEQCVFDNPKSGIANKANSDPFEENLYHLIRAFHVAGRCSDCGECSRVCPQGIPLHLLSKKVIKDINTYFGPWQAGEDDFSKGPLTDFSQDDADPDIVTKIGGGRR